MKNEKKTATSEWMDLFHREAAGAKPLPVPMKELQRQKDEAKVIH